MNKQKEIVNVKDYIPQFSIAERDRRWQAAREQMKERGIDCMLVWGSDYRGSLSQYNIRYLAHNAYSQLGGIFVLPLVGEPVSFIYSFGQVYNVPKSVEESSGPFSYFKSTQDWVSDVREYPGVQGLVKLLKERGYEKATIGIAEPVVKLPRMVSIVDYFTYSTLLRELPQVNFVEATSIVAKLRSVLSNEEVEFIRKACDISKLKNDAFFDTANIGVRECEVFARLEAAGMAEGAEPYILNFYASGSVTDPYRQHLTHGKLPPSSPTTRLLKNGDLVMTEYHTSYGGYIVGAQQTVFLGEPPRELQNLYKAGMDILQTGINAVKPGVVVEDSSQAMISRMKELGLASSQGDGSRIRGDHAEGGPTQDMKWEPNMTFQANVDIYDPKWRDDVGIMVGDQGLVTKNGAEGLIGCPPELICK